MAKLRVHMFQNERWGRYHLPWYKKFIDFLKQFAEVEVVNYNKDGGTFNGRIDLQSKVGQFGNNPPLSDVDFIAENLDNGEFIVITFTKYFTSQVVHYLKSDKCLGIMSAHFSRRYIVEHLKRNRILNKLDKVHPFIFGFFQDFDVNKHREIRDNTDILNDKLYFKGGGWKGDEKTAYRNVVRLLYDKKYLDPNNIHIDTYLNQLSKQKIALSHYMDVDMFNSANEHPGELCYRDIEMMAIGVPYIRIEYKSEIHEAFIPNYHYIMIPREHAYLEFDKNGHEGVTNLIISKYNEVKNDDEFLKFISKNQRDWYDKNMRWPKSAELVINKLKLI